MAVYEATREQLEKYGLNGKDARRLIAALCALADYEGPIKQVLQEQSLSYSAHSEVCHALRVLADGKG